MPSSQQQQHGHNPFAFSSQQPQQQQGHNTHLAQPQYSQVDTTESTRPLTPMDELIDHLNDSEEYLNAHEEIFTV